MLRGLAYRLTGGQFEIGAHAQALLDVIIEVTYRDAGPGGAPALQ